MEVLNLSTHICKTFYHQLFVLFTYMQHFISMCTQSVCYRNDIVGNMPGMSLLKGWLEGSHFSLGSFCLCSGSGCDEPAPALVHTAAQGTVQITLAGLWCPGQSPGSAQGCSSAASAPGDTASQGKEMLRAVSTSASRASSLHPCVSCLWQRGVRKILQMWCIMWKNTERESARPHLLSGERSSEG